MEGRHTPGPWRVENVNSDKGYDHDICLGYDVPRAGSPILVASVYFDEEHDGPITQRQANWNAKLIAAAPTMYLFIERKAQEGDADAAAIIAAVSGRGAD